MIERFFVGFYNPYLRDKAGRFDIRGIFGHCEIWGYTADATWLFMDPQAKGMQLRVTHHHDDVQRLLSFRVDNCDLILSIAATDPCFSIPPVSLMSCASVAGACLGIRAFLPSTLKRRLLRNGAEIVHERPSRRPGDEA